MRELEIAGSTYAITKLPARQQMHIARRLLPVAQALVPLLFAAQGEEGPAKDELNPATLKAMGAMTDTVGQLSDVDFDYVIDHCLAAVRRKSGMGYQAVNVMTPQGSRLMFEDMDDLALQLRLVWEVIQENLSSFTSGLLQISPFANRPTA